jgi:hypothetical protein
MAEPPTSESMNPQARSWIVEYTVVSVGGAVLGPSGRARLASGACTARCQDRRAEILRETSGRRRDLTYLDTQTILRSIRPRLRSLGLVISKHAFSIV